MPLRHCTALDSTRLTHAHQNSLYARQTLSLLQSIHLSAYLQSIHSSFYQVDEPVTLHRPSQPARHGLPLSGPRSAPAALGSVTMPCDIDEGCLSPFPRLRNRSRNRNTPAHVAPGAPCAPVPRATPGPHDVDRLIDWVRRRRGIAYRCTISYGAHITHCSAVLA
jgi:hypothetical protein